MVAPVVVELIDVRFEKVEDAVTKSPRVVVGVRAPNELIEKALN